MNENLSKDRSLVLGERIERLILLIRGHKVMLDVDRHVPRQPRPSGRGQGAQYN
jgi:hypothetical protein